VSDFIKRLEEAGAKASERPCCVATTGDQSQCARDREWIDLARSVWGELVAVVRSAAKSVEHICQDPEHLDCGRCELIRDLAALKAKVGGL